MFVALTFTFVLFSVYKEHNKCLSLVEGVYDCLHLCLTMSHPGLNVPRLSRTDYHLSGF